MVLAWDGGSRETVTVATADRMQPIWSWQPAEGAPLASMPVALNSRLYVLLESGEMWQFDLFTGALQARLTLPEPVASPMVLREDRRGAIVVGQSLGVYMLELGDPLQVKDVVFPEKDRNALISRGMWVPPYAVVFENVLTESCHIVVFRDDEEGFAEVQREEISGRVWQAPEINGALFLVVTDQNTEAVFGLDLGNPLNPLYRLFTHQGPSPEYTHLPQFLSRPEAPFISMVGPTVVHFSVDPLKSGSQWNRDIVWDHVLPMDDYVPVQPLQYSDRSIVLAASRPGLSAVTVQCLDLNTGAEKWDVDLGSHAQEFLVGPKSETGYSRLLIRSESGQLFALRSEANGNWWTRPLSGVNTNASVDWAVRSDSLVWVTHKSPVLHCTTLKGKALIRHPLDALPASPVAVHETGLRPVVEGEPDAAPLSGIWVTFVDVDHRVQLVHLERDPRPTQYMQLPPDAPSSGWQRPMWIGGRDILLVHPQGLLVRAEVALVGDIAFLRQTGTTSSAAIVGSPIVARDRVWLSGRDGMCHSFDAASLALSEQFPLQAVPETSPVLWGDRICVGLRNGEVVLLTANRRSDGSNHVTVPVSSEEITHLFTAPHDPRLFATDAQSGLYAIDSRFSPTHVASTSAPAAAPPIACSGGVFIGTSRGSLEFISADHFETRAEP